MFCMRCGTKNHDDSLFCYQCGTKLYRPVRPAAAPQVKAEENLLFTAPDMPNELPIDDTMPVIPAVTDETVVLNLGELPVEETPVTEEAPVAEEVPMTGETPVAEEVPVTGEVPEIEDIPSAEAETEIEEVSVEKNIFENTIPNLNTVILDTIPQMDVMPESVQEEEPVHNVQEEPLVQHVHQPEFVQEAEQQPQQPYNQNMQSPNNEPKILTGGRAFGVMCLNFLHLIPVLGTIFYFILMIVFACSKKDPNKAGMCKGILLWTLLQIVILIILVVVFGAAIYSMMSDPGFSYRMF